MRFSFLAKLIMRSKAERKLPSPRSSIDSDSLTSFFIPWQKPNQIPPINAQIQIGQVVTFTEFCLFQVAVILLVSTIGLTGISIWSIVSKIQMIQILDCSTELSYFATPSAILTLPCFWIVLSVHNDPKSHKFLFLVIILLTFSIVSILIGVKLGFTHKFAKSGKKVAFEEFQNSIEDYGENEKVTKAWDEIQTRFECCGAENYTDWLKIQGRIPNSCCDANGRMCQDLSGSFGCLEIITGILVWQTQLFTGINCVGLFLQCCALFVVVAVFFTRNE